MSTDGRVAGGRHWRRRSRTDTFELRQPKSMPTTAIMDTSGYQEMEETKRRPGEAKFKKGGSQSAFLIVPAASMRLAPVR